MLGYHEIYVDKNLFSYSNISKPFMQVLGRILYQIKHTLGIVKYR